jgi:hypothetical protein
LYIYRAEVGPIVADGELGFGELPEVLEEDDPTAAAFAAPLPARPAG